MNEQTQDKASALPPQFKPSINLSSYDKYWQDEFRKIIESDEQYKGKWNWAAFFFSWIWCFTKGAWAYGLLLLATFLVSMGSGLYPVVAIGWAVLMGLRGNWIAYNVKIKKKQFLKSLF